MATIKDIADKLGVSVSTVSKGLNGGKDISESVRQQVLDTAVELGYKGRRRDSEHRTRICIFIENMEFESANNFGYEIILGFRQAAFKEHYGITVLPVSKDFQHNEHYDKYMMINHYAGSFILGFSKDDPWMKDIESTKFPTILLDNFISKNKNVSCISTDSDEGIDMAISHLIKLGHKKIAFLDGSVGSEISDQRMAAFIRSISNHGLEPDPELCVYGYFVADSAHYHVPGFLDRGATAIVCGNDLIATGVISECMTLGFKVPDDISVIGFDDLPISAHLYPPLTTVRQNRLDIGKSAYFILNGLIKGIYMSKVTLRPELIVRKSTGKCRHRDIYGSKTHDNDSVIKKNPGLYNSFKIKKEIDRK
jgi:LacI family repressor for deo operon, udp, cdd, tsx, nupC, and nupG